MGTPLPKIALIGRPNVGKSALFNRLCGKRLSIVDEEEGITRDRLYVTVEYSGHICSLIDTGGIDPQSSKPFNAQVKQQSELAIQEADVVILVVDGRAGPMPLDREVAELVLKQRKPVLLAVNKIDRLSEEGLIHQFHSLGISQVIGVSAMQGFQAMELMEAAFAFLFPEQEREEEAIQEIDQEEDVPSQSGMPTRGPIRVAIAGRSNVGKSTLLNRLLGAERAIVSPIAGTTRDAIDATLVVDGQEILLIDTAGIRRKKAEHEVVDKFAAVRTKEAIERSDVVLLIFDAQDGLTTQEKRIASEIEACGKSCVLIFNKWDLVKGLQMEHALRGVHEAVPFLAHCPTIFLSAKNGRNLEKIIPTIRSVYADRFRRIGTGALNKFIEKCIQKNHPPMYTGKRLRIYYMTQVQVAPPKFVFFVNRPHLMVESYKKYLINQFRETYQFSGCPIVFNLRAKVGVVQQTVAENEQVPNKTGALVYISESIL